MSTFFGHGRLRLYLLKMLDESPRHGYEIISLLRDRFLGVYSPSPGTIYPRLARLEEEGLVTHTEEGGRKVYSLTDKGRQELRERESDLEELEREITDSVRDIARAVKQDVRATISSLREELKFSTGEARRGGPERAARDERSDATDEGPGESTCGHDHAGQGSRWSREWERFTQGFGAFGAVWGRSGSEDSGSAERGGEQDFERALHEFSDKVRGAFHEAGLVGEAAARDLRRVLDDTVEVIRRDMHRWGPPRDDAERAGRSDEDDAESDAPGPGEGSTGSGAEADGSARQKPSEESRAHPMPPSDTPSTGDSWSTAVNEPEDPTEGRREDGGA